MKKLLVIPAIILATGCSVFGKKVDVKPEDIASAGACIAQVQTLASTAQSQVSACVALGKSVAAQATAK